MQSKAFCKSQNNTSTIILLLRDDNILLIYVYIAISVELLHLKPNCSFTNMLRLNGDIIFYIESFQKFLKIQEVMKLAYNY